MKFSIASLLISLCLASVLIILLRLFLSHKLTYKQFRIDFLSIFSFIITLRLLLPFEFANTQTVASQYILPAIYSVGKIDLINTSLKLTLGKILLAIWICGSIISLLHFFKNKYLLRNFTRSLVKLPENYLDPSVREMIPQKIKLYYSKLPNSPYTFGVIRPGIVFSNLKLSVDDQRFIVGHELEHIRRHDNFKKYVIEILVCIYWWYPLIYLFRREVNSIIEINIDYQMIKNKNSKIYFDYTECLIKVAKQLKNFTFHSKLQKEIYKNSNLSNFVLFQENTLTRRINFLLEEYPVKQTSWALKILLVILPLIITSVIIEPYYDKTKLTEGTFNLKKDQNETFILKDKETYYLIVKGKNLGKIKDFTKLKKDSSFKKLPMKIKKIRR